MAVEKGDVSGTEDKFQPCHPEAHTLPCEHSRQGVHATLLPSMHHPLDSGLQLTPFYSAIGKARSGRVKVG